MDTKVIIDAIYTKTAELILLAAVGLCGWGIWMNVTVRAIQGANVVTQTTVDKHSNQLNEMTTEQKITNTRLDSLIEQTKSLHDELREERKFRDELREYMSRGSRSRY